MTEGRRQGGFLNEPILPVRSMSHCKCPWYGQTFPIQYQTEEGSRPEMSSTLLLLRYYQPDSSTLCRSLLGLILTNSQGLYQTTTSIRAVWRMLAKSKTYTTCVLTKGFHSSLVPLSLTHVMALREANRLELFGLNPDCQQNISEIAKNPISKTFLREVN